jgi:ferric-dicitrate binding protein FerR (iron transport regulator)
MSCPNDETIRAVIAEQAGEWFVANEEGLMDTGDLAALAAWLRISTVHIEEFLGVSVVARDLKKACTDPEYSLEAILARASAEDGPPAQTIRPRVIEVVRESFSRRWFPVAAVIALTVILILGLLVPPNPPK